MCFVRVDSRQLLALLRTVGELVRAYDLVDDIY